MKAGMFIAEPVSNGQVIVVAVDPILNAAAKAAGWETEPAVTQGMNQREAEVMIEDIRRIVVGWFVERGVPVPEGYEEYATLKESPRWLWWLWRAHRQWLKVLTWRDSRMLKAVKAR